MEEEIFNTTLLASVSTERIVRKNMLLMNVKTLIARYPKSCHKRYPKRCRKYYLGKCRFENGCAYKHLKPSNNQDQEELNVKIEALEKTFQEITKTNKDNEQLKENLVVLEKVLYAMTRKVLYLERVLKDMKEKRNIEHVKEIETKN